MSFREWLLGRTQPSPGAAPCLGFTPFYVWWLHSLLLWLLASVGLGRDRWLQKTACHQQNSEKWESSLDGQLIGRHNKRTSLEETLVADEEEILWPALVGRKGKPEKKISRCPDYQHNPGFWYPLPHLLDLPICAVMLHRLQNTISNFLTPVLEKKSQDYIVL